MSAEELQVGDIWTHPEMRHKGLAAWALSWVVQNHAPNSGIWYLTTRDNLNSIGLAEKCGFKAYALAQRRNRFSMSWIAKFDLDLDRGSTGNSATIPFRAQPQDWKADKYLECTEIAGEEVSKEQLDRMLRRYYWAGRSCAGKDVVEVACGTGQGLEYLASVAKSLQAGDISPAMVKIAQANAPQKVRIQVLDAQCMPFENRSMDIVILFEAIYYLAHPESFLAECKRILRPGGKILISSANKDLFDFTPSPYSYNYFGTREFYKFFEMNGFKIQLFGDTRLQRIHLRQKIFRPIKKLATKLNLIPKSMESKRFLKRIIFGKMIEMPKQVWPNHNDWIEPDELPPDRPAFDHKVLFCEAMVLKSDHELAP